MGTCYTYLLFDDFDWGYSNRTKNQTIKDIKKRFPYVDILAQWQDYIVVHLDKTSPYGDKIQQLQDYCSSARYYGDSAPYDIQELEFKPLPKDPVVEANQPENRNKKYIDEAYSSWKDTFNATNSNN